MLKRAIHTGIICLIVLALLGAPVPGIVVAEGDEGTGETTQTVAESPAPTETPPQVVAPVQDTENQEIPEPSSTFPALPPTPTPGTQPDAGEPARSAVAPSTVTPATAPDLAHSSVSLEQPTKTRCEPKHGGPALLSQASSLIYRCSTPYDIAVQMVAAETVGIEWEVSVAAPAGMSVQMLFPSQANPEWSPAGHQNAKQSVRVSAGLAPASATTALLSGSVEPTFHLKLTRDQCSSVSESVQLTIKARATGTERQAHDTQSQSLREVVTLSPETPLPANPPIQPQIEEFQVDPLTFSISEQVTTGSLTFAIELASPLCTPVVLLAYVSSSTGTATYDYSEIDPASTLWEGVSVSHIAKFTPLSVPVEVAEIASGAGPGILRVTIDFEMFVPPQLAASGEAATLQAEVYWHAD